MKTDQQNADHAPHDPRREHAEAEREPTEPGGEDYNDDGQRQLRRETKKTTTSETATVANETPTTGEDGNSSGRKKRRQGELRQQEQHKMIFQQHFGAVNSWQTHAAGGATMAR